MNKTQLKSAVLGGLFSFMLMPAQASIIQGQFSAIQKAGLSLTMNDEHGNALTRCSKPRIDNIATCSPICNLSLGCTPASVTVTNNLSTVATNVHASSSDSNFAFIVQDASGCTSVAANGGTCTLFFSRGGGPQNYSIDCIAVSGDSTGSSYFSLSSSCGNDG